MGPANFLSTAADVIVENPARQIRLARKGDDGKLPKKAEDSPKREKTQQDDLGQPAEQMGAMESTRRNGRMHSLSPRVSSLPEATGIVGYMCTIDDQNNSLWRHLRSGILVDQWPMPDFDNSNPTQIGWLLGGTTGE